LTCRGGREAASGDAEVGGAAHHLSAALTIFHR
jgi:hypothetical protein